MGCYIKASTTSTSRLQELSSAKVEAFILDIEQLASDIEAFLQADLLIVNIPSKNISGFQDLITAIEKSDIRKVLFVSSTSVYKNENKTVFESNISRSTEVPLLKIERLFGDNEKFRTTILRMGGLIGYSRNPGNFLKPERLVKNPDATVNLIHRDDCIEIICQIIEQGVWGEIFNCCADTHPTRREYYSKAARLMGAPRPNFVESGNSAFKIVSNQKVKHMLGYDFLYSDLMEMKFEES